jgi:hypothetical protein
VGLGLRDITQAWPPDVRLHQRLLEQALGQLVVTDDQVRQSEQRR